MNVGRTAVARREDRDRTIVVGFFDLDRIVC